MQGNLFKKIVHQFSSLKITLQNSKNVRTIHYNVSVGKNVAEIIKGGVFFISEVFNFWIVSQYLRKFERKKWGKKFEKAFEKED